MMIDEKYIAELEQRAESAERQLEQSKLLIYIGQYVITDATNRGWQHKGNTGRDAYDFLLRKMYEAGLKDAKKCT